MIYWIIPNHNSSKPLSCGLWFKFWQNISNNGAHLTLRILRPKNTICCVFSLFPISPTTTSYHCQSHAIFSDAYFTVEIMLGRSARRICNNGPLTALLDYSPEILSLLFTLPYIPTFHYKENLSQTFFVKFLEAVTVIREIMIGWKTFLSSLQL